MIPEMVAILDYALDHGPYLFPTNATEPLLNRFQQILPLRDKPFPLSFRVSLDHPDPAAHDHSHSHGNFRLSLKVMEQPHRHGFAVSITRQSDKGEDAEAVNRAYIPFFREARVPEDTRIVVFPEFHEPGSHPEAPHFEEMLYDQAQLATTYLAAYQITKDPIHADTARGILDYILRDMTEPDGQFFSAEDADSGVPGRPGEQAKGAFYVWEHDEVARVLGNDAAAIFSFQYGIERNGNVCSDPQGEFPRKNVLYVAHSIEDTANRFNKTPVAMRELLAEARANLLIHLASHPRPHLDDKTLTAWNGLTISAFAHPLSRAPHALPAMLAALDFQLGHPKLIVIAGKPGSVDTLELLRTAHTRFIPNKVLFLADGGQGQEMLARHYPFISELHPIDGKATAYVCENGACQFPATDSATLRQQLAKPDGKQVD